MDPDSFKRPEKLKTTFQRTLLFITAGIIMASCGKKSGWIEVDPAFSKYIDAYTTGVVSKTTSIRIQLAADAATTHAVGEMVKENLFSFSPSIKGKAYWLDARTIEFKPDEKLKPDQQYNGTFKLDKVTRVPDKYGEFKFSLQTVKPSFKVTDDGLRSSNVKNKMFISGQLETADVEDGKAVEKLLTVVQGAKTMAINWQHNDAAKSHIYIVENIERGKSASQLEIRWNGKPMSMDVIGDKKLDVPAQGDFKVLEVKAVNEAQQYASVLFSDPLAIGQELDGLISISGQSEISYTINGSEVKVFTSGKLDGNYTVNINAGVKNIWGDVLNKGFAANIIFENKLPSVKIHGKGNILPNSGRLVLPFDAVNLNAVDISIIKIFENNVPQFLQENDLGGKTELRRVAKPIVQKTLRLDSDKTLDLHKKQRFSLDIDKFIKTEPGAIYRVTIGFRPTYSVYSKVDTSANNQSEEEEGEYYYDDEYDSYSQGGVDDDDDFWSRYDTYYPFGYNWDRRDDPMSKSYYNKERWATRNIIATNIGLTAKRGNDNSLLVAATNILSTNPMSGVDLEVMDYQQTVIGKAKTSGDGFANIDLKRKPYLVVAKQGNERSYLKLDDGSSLSLSRFDVSGEEVNNGVKGFIFGERGVWRPGDTMYINAIVEDRENKIPKDHPAEFSLFTPQGQLFKQLIQTNEHDGFFVFKTHTEQNSPTGSWLARVKIGGAVFEKRIRVETVMPNRLKINMDFGADPILGKDQSSTGTLQAKWLFGATARNLKAKIDASLSATKTAFKGYDGFRFDNPATDYSTQDKVIFDGALNDSGKAQVKTAFETEAAPGMLRANMLVKVFEPGGNFSIDNLQVPYSPYTSYAGIKIPQGEKPFNYLLSGKTHTAQLANVDSRGRTINGTQEFEVQFYRVQWRWWWDESSSNITNFTQDEYNKLIKTETVKLTNGKGSWSFSTGENEWGRFLVLVKDKVSGHTTGSVIYVDQAYGWQQRGGDEELGAATMLSFTSNKEKFNVGEEVVLTIPSSKGGRVLVSLENGSRVIQSFWRETKQGQTSVSFKADASMSPNVFATVSLLQPHAQTLNDLPIRMYGSMPILVEDKNSYLSPQIDIPNAIRPEQDVTFKVSEKNNKSMTYVVALVDEGLLDLTRFKTPDPHAAFFAREALGVKSFDLFDYVIGAWGGDLERILTIGGDMEAGPVNQKSANRFKPVVQFLGPFTSSGGSKSHTVKIPNYIGSLRAMVIAARDGKYGMAEKAVAVKKPLMMLATMPRVLGPGETIKLPVTVFAMENNIRNVSVSLQSNPFLEVVGSNNQSISFNQPGEQIVYFDVKVKPEIGIGKVKLNASSGSEKASTEVELDVRNPNPPVTSYTDITIAPGQRWESNITAIGSIATSTATLEISNLPALNLQKRLEYLIDYPHGCIEQTTSAVFPQLVLNQLIDLDDYRKSLVERNIRAGISRIQNFQRSDGGFGYWPGASESDEWGSTYAGHFLMEAAAAGYTVSDYTLQQWKNYQKGKAASWVPSTTNFYGGDLMQSYRLYTLALAKVPELGAMNRLKEFKYLSSEAKWRLAAAYKLAGQDNTAADLISGLPIRFDQRSSAGFTYGSALRDEAMVLETLTLMGKKQKAEEVMRSVASQLSQDSWYSTQTTAYSMLAIARYCGKNPSGSKIVGSVTVDGKSTDVNTQTYLRQFPVVFKKATTGVSIVNKGSNILYLRVVNKGQPLAGDSLRVVNNPGTLVMNVSYMQQNGSALDVSKLRQGTDFVAKVTMRNPSTTPYREMALSQIFPSGWEILNARMTGGEGAYKSSNSTYQDIRDDRVYTYFNLAPGAEVTYYVQLNASYLGRYFLPGTFAEAMYDNKISAGVNGKWVQVE